MPRRAVETDRLSLADLLSAADICPAFNDKKAELYASQEWQDRANSTAVFLAQVEEITGIVNVTLENFYDVWDPISCQISHKLVTNKDILANFAQIQALADWVRRRKLPYLLGSPLPHRHKGREQAGGTGLVQTDAGGR